MILANLRLLKDVNIMNPCLLSMSQSRFRVNNWRLVNYAEEIPNFIITYHAGNVIISPYILPTIISVNV